MEDFLLIVEQIEISTNDKASYIFGEVTTEILVTFLVIVLILYFGNLALSFLKNI